MFLGETKQSVKNSNVGIVLLFKKFLATMKNEGIQRDSQV